MGPVRDLYQILGVPHDATQEDIKKAYRRLAREYHPDVSQSHDAEERFKEIAAAYEILSDPEKRQQYDVYGQGGGAEVFPFGDVADIFEAFFGAGAFGQRRATQQTRRHRGEDVFATVMVTLEEAAFGAHRDLQVERLDTCDRCDGSGAEPGTSPSRCRTCSGAGQVQDVRRSIFGTVMTARPCVACEGTGQEILTKCERCFGNGRVGRVQTIPVDVPPGVADGVDLRVSGAGHGGRAGAERGDLYLSISVREHPVFERRGRDLFAVLEVPMVQAALGAEIELETLDGTDRIQLEPGKESGTTLRLKGRGMPNLGRRGRGDLFVTVQVLTPSDLSREEQRLLEQLAQLRGEVAGKRVSTRGNLRRPSSG
jgi:molecular chaperone DnaJ